MKLIVGLGNPGKEYEKTLHNAGFMVLDALCDILKRDARAEYAGSEKHQLYDSQQFWVSWENGVRERIVLFKPLAYMNDSGGAVSAFARYCGKEFDSGRDLWIVHDDGDIALGSARVGVGQRHAGHRGVASIIVSLGKADYVRFRIGIRREGDTRRTETFVLKKPRSEDRKKFEESIRRTAEGILVALEHGIPKAQMFLHSDKSQLPQFDAVRKK